MRAKLPVAARRLELSCEERRRRVSKDARFASSSGRGLALGLRAMTRSFVRRSGRKRGAKVGGWTKTRPVSLGLLPSGPDPVGERYVLRQPPVAYVDHKGFWRKRRRRPSALSGHPKPIATSREVGRVWRAFRRPVFPACREKSREFLVFRPKTGKIVAKRPSISVSCARIPCARAQGNFAAEQGKRASHGRA